MKVDRYQTAMQLSVPYLVAARWFDATYRRPGLFGGPKTSWGDWAFAMVFAFQIGSITAAERPDDPATLMRFVGVADQTLDNLLDIVRKRADEFREQLGRSPRSPFDHLLGVVVDIKWGIVDQRRIDALSRRWLTVDRDETHVNICRAAMHGVAFGLLYPRSVEACLTLERDELSYIADDDRGALSDVDRRLAYAGTMRLVAQELHPRTGGLRHLDFWDALHLHKFANATVGSPSARRGPDLNP